MNIDEIKGIVDRIVRKNEAKKWLEDLLLLIDDRTAAGLIEVEFGKRVLHVDAVDFKKLVDKRIAEQDVTADIAELKQKAK